MIDVKVVRKVQGRTTGSLIDDMDLFFPHPDASLREFYTSSPEIVKFCLGMDREASAQVHEVDFALLRDVYEPPDGEVERFLKSNAFLVELLGEAIPKIRECFGSETKVQLELVKEPDNNPSRLIYARILTTLKPKDALAIRSRFDEEWWFDAVPRAKYLLNFALRYV
jgi:hypothetical protein